MVKGRSAIVYIKHDKHYHTRGRKMTHKKSCGFPTHSGAEGRGTHRHAECSNIAFKVCRKRKGNAIDSAVTFC